MDSQPPTDNFNRSKSSTSQHHTPSDRSFSSLEFENLTGQTLDVCYLEKKLGEGGMGSVYLAQHLTLQKKVAIKILPPEMARNQKLVERFFREARSAAKLEHPNIVQVFDVRSVNRATFIVMQYIEGTTLRAQVESETLSLSDKLKILMQVAVGLSFAHKRNIVHRDIKADNIMISSYGEVKIADFGLAKLADEYGSQLTSEGQILGTPDYMPPEICTGQSADARSDIYSLGVLFYFTLANRLPFEADNVPSLLLQHVGDEPAPLMKINPEVNPSLNYIVLKMLQKSPEDRYQDLEETIEDLKVIMMGQNLKASVIRSAIKTTTEPLSPAKADSGIFDTILDSTHQTTHQLKTFFEEVPKRRIKPFVHLFFLLLIGSVLFFAYWKIKEQVRLNSERYNPPITHHTKEPKKDPTKETKDPTKETKDPTKEVKEPTKEVKDPTKEVKDPFLLLKEDLDKLIQKGKFKELRILLSKKLQENPSPEVSGELRSWLLNSYKSEIVLKLNSFSMKQVAAIAKEAKREFPGEEEFATTENNARVFLFFTGVLSEKEAQILLKENSEFKQALETFFGNRIQEFIKKNEFEKAYKKAKKLALRYKSKALAKKSREARNLWISSYFSELENAVERSEKVKIEKLVAKSSQYELTAEEQKKVQGYQKQFQYLKDYQEFLKKIAAAKDKENYKKVKELFIAQKAKEAFKDNAALLQKEKEFLVFHAAIKVQDKEKQYLSELQEYLKLYPSGEYSKKAAAELETLNEFLAILSKLEKANNISEAKKILTPYQEKNPPTHYLTRLNSIMKTIQDKEFLEIRFYQNRFYTNGKICVRVFKIKGDKAFRVSTKRLKFSSKYGFFQNNFFTASEPGEYTIKVDYPKANLSTTKKIEIPVSSFSGNPVSFQLTHSLSDLKKSSENENSRFTLKLKVSNESSIPATGVILSFKVLEARFRRVKSKVPGQKFWLDYLEDTTEFNGQVGNEVFFEDLSIPAKSSFEYELEFISGTPEKFQIGFSLQCFENKRQKKPLTLNIIKPFVKKEPPVKKVRLIENVAANNLWKKALESLNAADTPLAIFNREGKLSDARNNFHEIIKRYPTSTKAPLAAYELGMMYFKGKNWNGALENFKKCIEFDPTTSLDVRYKIGQLYEVQFRNRAEARLWYERILRESTNRIELKRARSRLKYLR